jgi:dCMP deaminase
MDLLDIIKKHDSRLSWDEYFINLSFLVSKRSACDRLHVGCVLVKESRVISAGYNGFLPKASHKSVVRNDHEQMTNHAEMNAICDCAKRGTSSENAIAYITHFPCIICFKLLAAAGIKQIKYHDDYKNDELVKSLAMETGISIQKL